MTYGNEDKTQQYLTKYKSDETNMTIHLLLNGVLIVVALTSTSAKKLRGSSVPKKLSKINYNERSNKERKLNDSFDVHSFLQDDQPFNKAQYDKASISMISLIDKSEAQPRNRVDVDVYSMSQMYF